MFSRSSDSGCLDEERLLGWVEGTLGPELQARTRVHVEACEVCFAAIAEVHASSSRIGHEEPPRYALGVEIGRGGMGIVYRGRDRLLDRDVAIKVMHGDWGADETRERLLKESTAMAQLRHENVVAVHDVVIEDGQAFVVMELVEGKTLRLWFETRRPSSSEVVAMFEQIGRGLEAAHQAGIVHRDFKPDNVLVGERGRPRIVDFGIASTPRSAGASTIAGGLPSTDPDAGTPGYMAPEQCSGGPLDARADQYAFCVSMWEMLYGDRPTGSSVAAGGRRLPRIRRVLARGLATRPEARFEDMGSLLRALAGARRFRWPAVATVGVVVLASAVAAVGLSEGSSPATSCLETARTIAEPSASRVSAIAQALQRRDGLRGELLARRVEHDIARTRLGLGEALTEVCERLDSEAWRPTAVSCLLDIDAELTFIVEGAAHGDLELLHEIQRLSPSRRCAPLARERGPDSAPSLWTRWGEDWLRAPIARAEVLARRMRPQGAVIGHEVVSQAQALGHRSLQTRALVASARSRWDVDPPSARADFEAAVELAGRGDDRFQEASVWLAWGLLAQGSWDTTTVARALERARDAHAQLSDVSLREALAPRIAVLSMLDDFNAGRTDEARMQARAARSAARSLPDEMPLFAELEVILAMLDGDVEAALRNERVWLQWTTSNGLTSSVDLAGTHAAVAELELDLGRVEEATASLDDAQQLVDATRASREQRHVVDCVAARAAAERGDFAAAAARLEPHLDAIGSPGPSRDALGAETLTAWGTVLIAQGRFAEATRVLTRARSLAGFDGTDAIGGAIEVVLPLAIALRRDGRAADARTSLAPILTWHQEHYPELPITVRALCTMAWLDVDQRKYASARTRFADARNRLVHPLDRAWADFGHAVASAQLGGAEPAQAQAQGALRRLLKRAPSHRFEIDAIRVWLAAVAPADTESNRRGKSPR